MSDQIITCPHCQKEIPLTQALSHQLQEEISRQYDSKIEQKEKEYQSLLKKQETELKTKLETEIQKKFKEENSLELQDLQKQLSEKKSKVEEMQKHELELREEKRKIEEEKKQIKLDVQRQLDIERKKIEESLTKQILDEHRLKEAEKDKIIGDLKSALEDAQKKASQGSQQTQGEVLELELETLLRKEFPLDNVAEIKKGVRGADILQEVFDRNGRACGKILWESKNAEWSNQWATKLREDQRNSKADLAALVSVNLPESVKTFVFKDGIWMCAVDCFLALAYALRFNLVQVQQIKIAASSKGEKKDELYDYITGLEFKHRVEAMVESYKNLLEDIETEKRWFTNKWAKQEKRLRTLLDQTGSFHGELESIVGPSLPPVKEFSLEQNHDTQQSELIETSEIK